MQKFLKEIADIFAFSKKRPFLHFLYELLLFIFIASISAIVISFPIFYLGTIYPSLYKKLGLALGMLLMFLLLVYYIFKGFSKEKLSKSYVSSSSKRDKLSVILFLFIDILPLWLRGISLSILSLTLIFFVFLFLSKAIVYLLFSVIGFNLVILSKLNLLVSGILNGITLFISDYALYILLFYFGLLSLVLLFSAKSILKRHPFMIWVLFVFVCNIVIFIFYIFLYVILRILF